MSNVSKTKENLVAAGKAGGILVIAAILFFLYILGVLFWYLQNP